MRHNPQDFTTHFVTNHVTNLPTFKISERGTNERKCLKKEGHSYIAYTLLHTDL